MTSTLPPLSIIQWNCRSLRLSKLEQFKATLNETNPSVVLLSETHWRDKHMPTFYAYRTFFINRPTTGGGVAILVRNDLKADKKSLPALINTEAVKVSLKLEDGKNLEILSVYCPDGTKESYTDLEALLNSTGNLAIIGGDFNAHHPIWEDGHAPNRCGRELAELLLNDDSFSLVTPKNLNTRPGNSTSPASTIDLDLMSTSISHLATVSLGQHCGSDHLPVLISTDIHLHERVPPVRWKFKERDWPAWNNTLQSMLVEAEILECNDPRLAYHVFYESIIDVSKQFFQPRPRHSVLEKPRPWWTEECRIAVRESHKAYAIWRRTLLASDKARLNRTEARKKQIIMAAKRNHLTERSTISRMEDHQPVFGALPR